MYVANTHNWSNYLTKLACILAKMPTYKNVHPFLSSKSGVFMLANWLTRTNDKSIIKAMHVLVLLLTAITSYTQCPGLAAAAWSEGGRL